MSTVPQNSDTILVAFSNTANRWKTQKQANVFAERRRTSQLTEDGQTNYHMWLWRILKISSIRLFIGQVVVSRSQVIIMQWPNSKQHCMLHETWFSHARGRHLRSSDDRHAKSRKGNNVIQLGADYNKTGTVKSVLLTHTGTPVNRFRFDTSTSTTPFSNSTVCIQSVQSASEYIECVTECRSPCSW